MAEPLYTLTNVSFSYSGNIPALNNLDLTIGQGERIALIGANGNGKIDAASHPRCTAISFIGYCRSLR